MFSVVLHSALYERIFSALGWLYRKKRITLDINTVEVMAKILDYNKNNNNEDGYEEIFETQILNYEVYVLIEDNVDLTNIIFLNNKKKEKNENL
ncbi:hypothetical protein C1646_775014 [Rhizophagus diaphanus]|nr:hypothetical protein C1646_775014 [Rhizophagus diaphanus] [Rhizophagus sp. MUCL 43196]